MKKITFTGLALAFVATAMISCGESADKKDQTGDSTTITTTTTTTTTAPPADAPKTETASTDAPSFSNEEVNKGLAEYKSLINDYVKAIESKDQATATALTTKYQQVATNMQSWITKVKPDEAQKLTDYMQKLGNEWSAAATKAAGAVH